MAARPPTKPAAPRPGIGALSLVNPSNSNAGQTNDNATLVNSTGTEEYAVIYDMLSEGEIEGLVNGPASVYFNATPLMTGESVDAVGAIRTTGSITASQNTLTLNTDSLDRADASTLSQRYVTIAGAGTSGAPTISTTANSPLIVASATLFSAGQQMNGLISVGQEVVIPGAGAGGSTYVGRVVYVISGTIATVNPRPSTAVSTVTAEFNLVTTISSYNPSTNVITLADNAVTTVTDAVVTITSPRPTGPNTNANKWNYPGSSVGFRTGTFDQDRLPTLSSTSTNASYFYQVNQQLYQYETYAQWEGRDTGGAEYQISATGMQVSNPEETDRIKVSMEFPSMFLISDETGNEFPSWVEIQIFFRWKVNASEGSWREALVVGRSIDSSPDEPTKVATENNGFQPLNHIGYITNKTKQKFIREFVIDLSEFQPFVDWEIGIRRANSDVQDYMHPRYLAYNESFVKSLEAQVIDKVSYSGTAYAGVTYQAKDFSTPPQRAYHLRGKKILVPTNYITRDENNGLEALYTRNVTTGTNTGSEQDWDGNFRGDVATFTSSRNVNFNKVYCNNPAWVFYDLVQNPLYGLGQFVDTSIVDKYSLYQIARYCDELVTDGKGGLEPRFTCNVYITTQSEAYKLLKDLATVFRGILYWINGEIVPVQDRPKEATYTFTQGNIIDGLFEYESVGQRVKVNQVRVAWNDPDNMYQQAVEVVEDTDNIVEANRINPISIVAFGCTSQGQAHRAGQWYLTTSALENEVVKFSTSTTASFLEPGSIINVQDHEKNSVQYSGRISNTGTLTSATIPLDRTITLQSGTSYLHCFFPEGGAYLEQESASIDSVGYVRGNFVPNDYDGTPITSRELAANARDDAGNFVHLYWSEESRIETKTISTSPGNVDSISVTGNFSQAPERESIWAISSESAGIDYVSKKYRILGIEELGEEIYSITASLYNLNKYTIVDYGYEINGNIITGDPSILDEDIPIIDEITFDYRPMSTNLDDRGPGDSSTNEGNINQVEAVISWNVPLATEPTNTLVASTELSSEATAGTRILNLDDTSSFSSSGFAIIGTRNTRASEWVKFGSKSASPARLTAVYRGRLGTKGQYWPSGTSIKEYNMVSVPYKHLAGYTVSLSGGNLNAPIVYNLPASQNELVIRNLDQGTYSVSIRSVNSRGNFSPYTTVVRSLTLNLSGATSRTNRTPTGGQIGVSTSFDTDTGAFSITQVPFGYISPNGSNYTFSSPVSEDASTIPSGETGYLYHDPSDAGNTTKFMQIQVDDGWASSDGAASQSPPTYGSFSWWKTAGATHGLTEQTGTIDANIYSIKLEGSGTSFLSNFTSGSLIRLDSAALTSYPTTTAWYGEVSYVESDTVLYTKTPITKAFTGGKCSKQAFTPDFSRDSLWAKVDRIASPPSYEILYYTTTAGSDGNIGISAQAVSLSANRYVNKFDADGNRITQSPDNIEITAEISGEFGSPVYYRFKRNEAIEQDWSTDNTFTIVPASQAAVDTVDNWKVEASDTGGSPWTIEASDTISIYAIQDGDQSLLGFLSNDAHVEPTDANGDLLGGSPLQDAGGAFRIFKGLEEISLNPEIDFSVVGTNPSNGLQIAIDTDGAYTLTEPTDWTSDEEAFRLRATYTDVSPNILIDKIYTISKSKAGIDGNDGTSGTSAYTLILTNEAHNFFADFEGIVSGNDFTCIAQVKLGGQAYSYDGTPSYASNSFRYANFSDNNCFSIVDASGNITITGASSILNSINYVTASITFEVLDNIDDSVIATKIISLTKTVSGIRGAATFNFEEATDPYITPDTVIEWTNTGSPGDPFSNNDAAIAVANAVIGVAYEISQGWIRPGDRITVSDQSAELAATRIYQGTATNNSATVLAASFSTLVVEIFDGSVIVDGTLSAQKLLAGSTITNTLNVEEQLKFGEGGALFNTAKTSYDDTSGGFFMGWDDVSPAGHKFAVGTGTNYLKYSVADGLVVRGEIIVENAPTVRGALNVEDGATNTSKTQNSLLRNSYFNEGSDYWSQGGTGATVNFQSTGDTGGTHNGTYCISLDKTDSTSHYFRQIEPGTASNPMAYPAAEGDRFEGSVWYRYSGTGDVSNGYIRIYWRDENKANISYSNYAIAPTTSWQQLKVVATAPAGTHFAWFYFGLYTGTTSGRAFFDDASLYKYPKDTDMYAGRLDGDEIIGSMKINGGSISVGKSSAASQTDGFWLGTDGASGYDFHVGDDTTYLRWDADGGTPSGGLLSIGGDIIASGNLKANSVTTNAILLNNVVTSKIAENNVTKKYHNFNDAPGVSQNSKHLEVSVSGIVIPTITGQSTSKVLINYALNFNGASSNTPTATFWFERSGTGGTVTLLNYQFKFKGNSMGATYLDDLGPGTYTYSCYLQVGEPLDMYYNSITAQILMK